MGLPSSMLYVCRPTLLASACLSGICLGQYSPPGPTHDLLYTVWGTPAFPIATGFPAVYGGVDLNGDGRSDFVIASPGVNSSSGGVRALSGSNGSAMWTSYGVFQGPGPLQGEMLGSAVEFVDWDSDGQPDVAAGAFNYCAPPCLSPPVYGRVQILRGLDGQLITTLLPPGTLAAAGVNGMLYAYGIKLGGGADLTGDGVSDLVVVANWGPASLGFLPGAAFVIEVPSGQVAGVLWGTVPDEWFGAGDTGFQGGVVPLSAGAGAGSGRLAVGSPRTYSPGTLGHGSIRLFDCATLTMTFQQYGSTVNEQLGSFAVKGPDLDQDGIADFAAARWPLTLPVWPWSQPWSVDVRSGADGQLLYTFGSTIYPIGPMGHLWLTFVPDMSGDGIPELLSSAGAGGASRIQVHSGANGSQLYVWVYPQSAGFGPAVYAYSLGDLNEDGWGDVGIVHPGAADSSGQPVGKLEAYARRSLKALTPPTLGGNLVLQVQTPRLPGRPYFLLFSASTSPPLTVGPFVIPLAADALFWASLGFGLVGVLDPSATATLTIPIPYDPSLSGATVHASGIVVDAASPYGIGTVLTKLALTVP